VFLISFCFVNYFYFESKPGLFICIGNKVISKSGQIPFVVTQKIGQMVGIVGKVTFIEEKY
jgi:hypothetical protein